MLRLRCGHSTRVLCTSDVVLTLLFRCGDGTAARCGVPVRRPHALLWRTERLLPLLPLLQP
jgi:hypothetical protein